MIKLHKFLFYFLISILSLISCNKDKDSCIEDKKSNLNFETNFIGNWNLRTTQLLFGSDTLIKSFEDNYQCQIFNDKTLYCRDFHYKFDSLYWQFRDFENKVFIIVDYYGPDVFLYRDMNIKVNEVDFIELESKTRFIDLKQRLVENRFNYQFTRIK